LLHGKSVHLAAGDASLAIFQFGEVLVFLGFCAPRGGTGDETAVLEEKFGKVLAGLQTQCQEVVSSEPRSFAFSCDEGMTLTKPRARQEREFWGAGGRAGFLRFLGENDGDYVRFCGGLGGRGYLFMEKDEKKVVVVERDAASLVDALSGPLEAVRAANLG
jgi:hypothetical protein